MRHASLLLALALAACATTRSGEPASGSGAPDAPAATAAPGPGMHAFIRALAPELRSCVEEARLEFDPSLAGDVLFRLAVDGGGRVTEARVARCTWRQAGADAAEACMLARIRQWRFPTGEAPAGTYAVPLSFSR